MLKLIQKEYTQKVKEVKMHKSIWFLKWKILVATDTFRVADKKQIKKGSIGAIINKDSDVSQDSWAEFGANIRASSIIEGSFVGKHAVVRNSKISNGSLIDGSKVKISSSHVSDSHIDSGTKISDGSYVSGCSICGQNVKIEHSEVLQTRVFDNADISNSSVRHSFVDSNAKLEKGVNAESSSFSGDAVVSGEISIESSTVGDYAKLNCNDCKIENSAFSGNCIMDGCYNTIKNSLISGDCLIGQYVNIENSSIKTYERKRISGEEESSVTIKYGDIDSENDFVIFPLGLSDSVILYKTKHNKNALFYANGNGVFPAHEINESILRKIELSCSSLLNNNNGLFSFGKWLLFQAKKKEKQKYFLDSESRISGFIGGKYDQDIYSLVLWSTMSFCACTSSDIFIEHQFLRKDMSLNRERAIDILNTISSNIAFDISSKKFVNAGSFSFLSFESLRFILDAINANDGPVQLHELAVYAFKEGLSNVDILNEIEKNNNIIIF